MFLKLTTAIRNSRGLWDEGGTCLIDSATVVAVLPVFDAHGCEARRVLFRCGADRGEVVVTDTTEAIQKAMAAEPCTCANHHHETPAQGREGSKNDEL